MAENVMELEAIEVPELDISHLITEDDTPVDNIFSEKQQRLLTETLYASWGGPGKARPFVALANVGLFYNINHQAVVPDVLVSLDVSLPDELWEKRHRSYFIWEYGKPPELVIEIVSNRQGGELTRKKELYAHLGIAYYIVYDPRHQLGETALYIFERRGSEYERVRKSWLPKLGLKLQLWEGEYEGIEAVWLRWYDQEDNLIKSGAEAANQERERADQERERADQERERADQERERAERLAVQLRALGIEPEL